MIIMCRLIQTKRLKIGKKKSFFAINLILLALIPIFTYAELKVSYKQTDRKWYQVIERRARFIFKRHTRLFEKRKMMFNKRNMLSLYVPLTDVLTFLLRHMIFGHFLWRSGLDNSYGYRDLNAGDVLLIRLIRITCPNDSIYCCKRVSLLTIPYGSFLIL